MAHGDYDCCAVCDDKLSYAGFDSSTKQEICSSCLKQLNQTHHLNIWSVSDFIAWIEKEEKVKLLEILKAVHFHSCYYSNYVDDAILKALGNDAEQFSPYRPLTK